MTEYASRPGGALFAIDPRKKTNPKQPDFDGELVIDPADMHALLTEWQAGRPVKLRLAGWKRKSQRGQDFMSLKGSLPRQQGAEQFRPVPQQQDGGFGFNNDPDDEIPF